MLIGIPKESRNNENRVAITPEILKKIIKLGYEVQIEKSAGLKRLHKAAISGESKGVPLDFIGDLIDGEWEHAEKSGGKTFMGNVVKGLTRKIMNTQNEVLYGRDSK